VNTRTDPPLYVESQTLREQPIVPMVAFLGLVPIAFLAPIMVTGVAAILLLILIGVAKLTVVVRAEEIDITYRPVHRRQIPVSEISEHEAVGDGATPSGKAGQGMKSPSRIYNRAYTLTGYKGVRVILTNGQTILIGSRTPQRLAQAIDRMRMQAQPSVADEPHK